MSDMKISSRSLPDPDRDAPAVRLKNYHYVVVLGSLVLTLAVWLYASTLAERQAELAFDHAAEQILDLTTERMEKYEDSLWAGVGALYTSNGTANLHDWRVFAQTMQIDVKYPGINGIGVILKVAKDDAGDFIAYHREERPTFDIHPPRESDQLFPITYIEPESENAKAVGLDVGFETNRRDGLLAARDTGTPQITGPITLVQDQEATPGFLFYVPFYRNRASATLEQRRSEFIGAVYAPFIVKKLMEGVLAKDRRHVWIRIADNDEVIYDEHEGGEAGYDPDPMYSRHIDLDMYGRTWQIDLRTNALFRSANERSQPLIILGCGLTIDLLLLILFTYMARSNRRAYSYADRVTQALREEKRQLISTNEALEQFSYVASHDLKTPLRGMRDATDYLAEELKDRFPNVLGDDHVSTQLSTLRHLITKMDTLVKGVLEYAQISKRAQRMADIDIALEVRRIAMEQGLGEDQLDVSCEVPSVRMDPLLFSQIMRNLLENAITHHQEQDKLKVIVTSRIRNCGIEIEIADNGPGIDPAYHEKIFEMFQMLKPTFDANSTGVGLAIVRKAAGAAGGTVSVRSSCGRGATFTVSLPDSVVLQSQNYAAE